MMTGNPVRQQLLDCKLTREQACEKMGLDPARPVVLIIGGSLGARTINESVLDNLDTIKQNDIQLFGKREVTTSRASRQHSPKRNAPKTSSQQTS